MEREVLAAKPRLIEGKEENERMLEAQERATRNHRRLALADWRKEKESITADAREVLDATNKKHNERILALDAAKKKAETETAVLTAMMKDLRRDVARDRKLRMVSRRKLDRARERALFREIDRRRLRADLRQRQEDSYMLGSAHRLDTAAAVFHAPSWAADAFLPGAATDEGAGEPFVNYPFITTADTAVVDDLGDEEAVMEVDMRTGMRAE